LRRIQYTRVTELQEMIRVFEMRDSLGRIQAGLDARVCLRAVVELRILSWRTRQRTGRASATHGATGKLIFVFSR
jgi:hypothetical protein